jgi:hypothetical protein
MKNAPPLFPRLASERPLKHFLSRTSFQETQPPVPQKTRRNHCPQQCDIFRRSLKHRRRKRRALFFRKREQRRGATQCVALRGIILSGARHQARASIDPFAPNTRARIFPPFKMGAIGL